MYVAVKRNGLKMKSLFPDASQTSIDFLKYMQARSEKNTSECLFYLNTGATQDNVLRFDLVNN